MKRRSILEISLGCQTVTPSATLPRELRRRVFFCHVQLRMLMMLSLGMCCFSCRMDDLAVDSDDEVDYSKMDQAWVILSCNGEITLCVWSDVFTCVSVSRVIRRVLWAAGTLTRKRSTATTWTTRRRFPSNTDSVFNSLHRFEFVCSLYSWWYLFL